MKVCKEAEKISDGFLPSGNAISDLYDSGDKNHPYDWMFFDLIKKQKVDDAESFYEQYLSDSISKLRRPKSVYLFSIFSLYIKLHHYIEAERVIHAMQDPVLKEEALECLLHIYISEKKFLSLERLIPEITSESFKSKLLFLVFQKYLHHSRFLLAENIAKKIPSLDIRTLACQELANFFTIRKLPQSARRCMELVMGKIGSRDENPFLFKLKIPHPPAASDVQKQINLPSLRSKSAR